MALFQNQLKVMNDKIDLLGERIMATRNSTRMMRHQEYMKQEQDLLLPTRLYPNQEGKIASLTSASLVFQQLPRKKVSIGIQVDLTQFEYNHESSGEDGDSIISSEDNDGSIDDFISIV